jgi:RNA polymerase sigma-70 factor (sigma-E family)
MGEAASGLRRVRGEDGRGALAGPGPQGGVWPHGVAVSVAGGAEAAPGPGDAPTSVAAGGAAEPGATGAVCELYRAHYLSLVRMAALLVGDVAAAEQVVQDSLVAMHANWRWLKRGEKALAFVRRRVINRSRFVLRHQVSGERDVGPPLPQVPSAACDAGPQLACSPVVAALDRLSRRQREVLVLRYYADLSEAETAAAMGISSGAVKSHTARAMLAIREALGPEA